MIPTQNHVSANETSLQSSKEAALSAVSFGSYTTANSLLLVHEGLTVIK